MPINPARILYEDADLLAVNKLSGELVVKGKGRIDKLPLLDFLRRDYPGLRTIHRLDFETSGVVIFAKTKAAFDQILANKSEGWHKTYLALVLDPMEKAHGSIDIPLDPRSGEGKVAVKTKYKVLETFIGCTYIEAEIERGLFHQIRRHFAAIHHPLLLDDEHGNKKLNRVFSKEFKYQRLFLHAVRLRLPHPMTGADVTIEAPLPRQFEDILSQLRKRK